MSYTRPARTSLTQTNRGRAVRPAEAAVAQQNAIGIANQRTSYNRSPERYGLSNASTLQPAANNSPTQQPLNDRVQRRDGYNVVLPDETKRQSIAQRAREEAEEYNEYKNNQRLSYVSYRGTVGGGLITEESARSKQQGSVKYSTANKWEKSRQLKLEQKKQEDEEIDKKKREQRLKAEQNQARLVGYDREKNAAFLNRFQQNQSKHMCSSSAANFVENSPIVNGSHGYSSPLDVLIREFPNISADVLENVLASVGYDIDAARDFMTQ